MNYTALSSALYTALHQCLKPQIRVNVCCTGKKIEILENRRKKQGLEENIRRAGSLCRIFASGHVPGSFKKAKNKSMQWRSGTDKTFAHRRKGWPSAPFLPVIARSVRRYVKPTFASNFSIQLSRDFIQNHSPTRRTNFAKKLYNAGGGNRFFNPH